MCKVNDEKRAGYTADIKDLQAELENENAILADLKESKKEIQKLVDEAQKAIDYLENCNFGGDKIISSVVTSHKGYKDRMAYYDEYIAKCETAIFEINDDITRITKLKDNLPKNCGYCNECSLSI